MRRLAHGASQRIGCGAGRVPRELARRCGCPATAALPALHSDTSPDSQDPTTAAADRIAATIQSAGLFSLSPDRTHASTAAAPAGAAGFCVGCRCRPPCLQLVLLFAAAVVVLLS